MAIQPIDLQTLFTQVDKVGRAQIAQKEGLSIQQTIQGIQLERKNEQYIQSVNEAQNTGDGVENIKDRREREQAAADGEKKRQEEDEQEQEGKKNSVIKDPSLGKNIDISM